ncbi:hypothetical protein ACOMHN_053708 [Nucella lapillus]
MSHKRTAHSPLSDEKDEKRLREDPFDADSDPDTTIINADFLSSSVIEGEDFIDSRVSSGDILAAMATDSGLKKELQFTTLLCEPDIIEMISKVVAAQFSDILKNEIASLKDHLAAKDKEIVLLKDKVDELEQYGRRNCFRLSGIPESPDESTDAIVKSVAQSISVNVTDDMIDRSHRVGAKPAGPGAGAPRPILVRMTSYRYKRRQMSEKKNLSQVEPKKVFPRLQWQTPAQSSSAKPSLFLNDDLTRVRAEIAALASEKKRKNAIDDTWVKDGVIFVKAQGTVHRVTTKRGVDIF